MKYIVSIAIIGLILSSCSKDSSDNNDSSSQNKQPTIPKLLYPTNNLLCIDHVLDFKWENSVDSDQDAIVYQIDIAKDNQFLEIVYTENTSLVAQTFTLEKGMAYYWRVKAIDSKGSSSKYSSIFNLFTEGEGIINHSPFSPELVKPLLNSIQEERTMVLEWNGSDADNDALTFDVYLDTVNPPISIVSRDQKEAFLTTTLDKVTNYYWKIVVKDGKGGEATGQVWNFTLK